jgi:hypothetical protein
MHLDISMVPLPRATLTQLEYGFRVNPHLKYPSRLWREKKRFSRFFRIVCRPRQYRLSFCIQRGCYKSRLTTILMAKDQTGRWMDIALIEEDLVYCSSIHSWRSEPALEGL